METEKDLFNVKVDLNLDPSPEVQLHYNVTKLVIVNKLRDFQLVVLSRNRERECEHRIRLSVGLNVICLCVAVPRTHRVHRDFDKTMQLHGYNTVMSSHDNRTLQSIVEDVDFHELNTIFPDNIKCYVLRTRSTKKIDIQEQILLDYVKMGMLNQTFAELARHKIAWWTPLGTYSFSPAQAALLMAPIDSNLCEILFGDQGHRVPFTHMQRWYYRSEDYYKIALNKDLSTFFQIIFKNQFSPVVEVDVLANYRKLVPTYTGPLVMPKRHNEPNFAEVPVFLPLNHILSRQLASKYAHLYTPLQITDIKKWIPASLSHSWSPLYQGSQWNILKTTW